MQVTPTFPLKQTNLPYCTLNFYVWDTYYFSGQGRLPTIPNSMTEPAKLLKCGTAGKFSVSPGWDDSVLTVYIRLTVRNNNAKSPKIAIPPFSYLLKVAPDH